MNRYLILGRDYIVRPMLAEAALERDLQPAATLRASSGGAAAPRQGFIAQILDYVSGRPE